MGEDDDDNDTVLLFLAFTGALYASVAVLPARSNLFSHLHIGCFFFLPRHPTSHLLMALLIYFIWFLRLIKCDANCCISSAKYLFMYTIAVNTIIYIPQMDFVCFQDGKHVPVRVKMVLSCLYKYICKEGVWDENLRGQHLLAPSHYNLEVQLFLQQKWGGGGGLVILKSPLGQKGNIYIHKHPSLPTLSSWSFAIHLSPSFFAHFGWVPNSCALVIVCVLTVGWFFGCHRLLLLV